MHIERYHCCIPLGHHIEMVHQLEKTNSPFSLEIKEVRTKLINCVFSQWNIQYCIGGVSNIGIYPHVLNCPVNSLTFMAINSLRILSII